MSFSLGNKFKKLVTLAITGALLLTACGSSERNVSVKVSDVNAAQSDNTSDYFDKYVSNTVLATSNNFVVSAAESITYRCYIPVEEAGKLNYRFYFSNTVDSTYDDGADAHIGMSGGSYSIESAYIADGGVDSDSEPTNRTAVTFDGEAGRSVVPDESYWSDEVEFDVPKGHYLVWEWTLSGTGIPCTNMSSLTATSADSGSGFAWCDQIPLPQLIGAERDVKYTIAAIGDSITQGCQTTNSKYEFWASKIYENLGEDYSLWNLGLGWSRASDAASCGNWLDRAKTADFVIVAFGTNDINSGVYGADSGDSARQLDTSIRTIIGALDGCTTILFNSPPENFNKRREAVRTEYNELISYTAQELGVLLFDFAGLLSDESDPGTALYGAHPNAEGGLIVANAFVEEYGRLLGVKA